MTQSKQENDYNFVPDQLMLTADQVEKLLAEKIERAEVQVRKIADLMNKLRERDSEL